MASINIKERTSAKGTTSFQVQVRGKGVDKAFSKSFTTMDAAEQWKAEQEQKYNGASTSNLEGNTPAQSTESTQNTVATLSDEYLRDTQYLGGVKKKGYKTVENRLGVIARVLGNKNVSELTKADIQEYTSVRLRTVTGASVRKELEILKRVLAWCSEE